MAWVITQSGDAVNLSFVTHLWLEDGTGRYYNGIATLKATEPGFQEDEQGERRFPLMHDICIVLGDSSEARPLIRALLVASHSQSVVDIADVVNELGLEFGHRMDHHP